MTVTLKNISHSGITAVTSLKYQSTSSVIAHVMTYCLTEISLQGLAITRAPSSIVAATS